MGALRKRLSAAKRWAKGRLAEWRAARDLRREVALNRGPLRVIIGASHSSFPGWVATEYPTVNVADWKTLERFFAPGSVSAILAEHVWEHLTPEQGEAAARNCHKLLKPEGYLRIAVPDGHHPDPAYIEYVRPGGGSETHVHKVLYTCEALCALLERAGFRTRPLEWFDERGRFRFEDWSPEDGYVARSSRFDERNDPSKPTAYTSIIVDAIKPE